MMYLLNIDYIYFEQMLHRIYPAELQLNKMAVDEERIDANDTDNEKKEEEEEEEEGEMEEEDISVIKLDLPPGCQEHQKVKEHTICLANHTNRSGCFLRHLISVRLNSYVIPRQKSMLRSLIPI